MKTVRDIISGGVIFIAFFLSNGICGNSCDIAPVDSGFGAPGTYKIVVDTFPAPVVSPRSRLYVFRPDTREKAPCILFCPKYGSENPAEYSGMITYLASKGFVVVYPPYRAQVFTRKSIEVTTLTDEMFGIVAGVIRPYIDTTRIGFIGHSYGAGIVPGVTKRIVEKMGWGRNGAFMYLLSPWYFAGISKRELQAYPGNVKTVIQVFDDDNVNDPRIGSYLFQMISIPPENKEFFIVYGDSYEGCRMKSDFTVPLSRGAAGGEDNALDVYAVNRLCDALTKAVFNNDTAAGAFVFGNSTDRKVYMGTWPGGTPVKAMTATDNPREFISAKPYINSWISPRNPFADVTKFRQARRVYIEAKKKKVKDVTSYLVDTKKKEKGAEDDIDVFENPVDQGYGADGPFGAVKDSVTNPANPENPVLFFYPDKKQGQVPLVILMHGYSGQEHLFFEPFISHIVSRGYAVLYPIYPLFPLVSNKKDVLQKIFIVKTGIDECMKLHKDRIDTGRVAVAGQSFGGGMAPCIGYHVFKEKNWGAAGAFLFITAPWYTFDITDEQYKSFPAQVKLLMMIFDDDVTNDHQMAVDIFNSINIPPENKDYVTLYSDSSNGLTMNANHFVPYGIHYIYGEQNLLDYYGTYKLFDAMAEYVFNNNQAARDVALGNGSKEQTYMGDWSANRFVKPCTVTDNPRPMHSQYEYLWSWGNKLNPRRNAYNPADSTVIKIKKRAKEAKDK